MPQIRSSTCIGCGVVRTRENTYWSKKDNGLRSRCKACVSKYHKDFNSYNPGYQDVKHLYYTFGLTPDDYDRILEAQGGVCAICKGPEPLNSRFSIDHDHSCCPGRKSCGLCIRGLLCRQCNTGLGNLGDSVETLDAAITYLESHTVKVVAQDCCGYTAYLAKAWLSQGILRCPHGTQMEVEVK